MIVSVVIKSRQLSVVSCQLFFVRGRLLNFTYSNSRDCHKTTDNGLLTTDILLCRLLLFLIQVAQDFGDGRGLRRRRERLRRVRVRGERQAEGGIFGRGCMRRAP